MTNDIIPPEVIPTLSRGYYLTADSEIVHVDDQWISYYADEGDKTRSLLGPLRRLVPLTDDERKLVLQELEEARDGWLASDEVNLAARISEIIRKIR